MRLARDSSAGGIYLSEDVSGYARERMRRLELACEQEGLSPPRVRGRHHRPARGAHPAERRSLPRLHALLACVAACQQARSARLRRESWARRRVCGAGDSQAVRSHGGRRSSDLPSGGGSRRPGPPQPLASKRRATGMWIWPTSCRRTRRHTSAPTCTSAACRRTRCSRESTSKGSSRTSCASSAGGTSTIRCWRPGRTSPTTTTGSGDVAGGRAPLVGWTRGRGPDRLSDRGRRDAPARRGRASSPTVRA